MNPIEIADKIQKALGKQANYLRPVGEHCPQLADEISRYPFCKALYVERIAKYKQSPHTLDDLKEEGIVEEETAKALACFFGKEPSNFYPYIHQENAIRDTRNGKNLIVCTGTGSGKTESFLMPVIDGIVRERKEKGEKYKEGIRAIILYPMNALVNDQVARIRKLISKARINNIEYAKDISFGIYTGDLKEKELEPVRLDVKEGECGCAKHRLFTHEETPPTEYVSREKWKEEGPADILITNYVMLEQLLLSPDKKGMFQNKTLKYFVLDEAHSYDGGLGTDIAWLVRRLVERFRCNGEIGGESDQTLNVQYIATTATLVDQSESDREKVIKEEFASKLFPAMPESFSVQFGEEEPDDYKQDDRSDGHTETVNKSVDYAGIVDRSLENENFLQEYVKSIREWKKSSDNQQDKCISAICDIMMPPQEGKPTLMQATQWLRSVQQWLDEWNFLVEEENHLANIDEELKQPVGDAMFLAEALVKLGPSFPLAPNQGSMKKLRDCYMDCACKHRKKVEDIISFYVSEREKDDTKKALNKWCENTEDNKEISARNFVILLQTIVSLTKIPDGREKADILLEWDKEFISSLEKLKGKLDAAQKKIATLEGELCRVWSHELKEDGDSIEIIVTGALKKREELDRCAHFFQSHKDKYEGKFAPIGIFDRGEKDTIEKSVFPDQEEADRKKNFNAFAQLLTLTRESGQPLMNLRFHLLTTGISGIAVYFRKNEKGEAEPHFVFDDDPHFEDETYYEGEEKYALFTLSICFACGFPFVRGFARERSRKEKTISRYELHSEEKEEHGYSVYFSWLTTDEDQKEIIWLNIQTGECSEKAKMPKEGCYVKLYKYKELERIESPVYTCPECEGFRLKSEEGAEGIISPYVSGASRNRIRILTELVKSSDPSINAPGVIAGGRKVLAFSDSRSVAARLALDLDSFVEESLLKQILVDILREQNNSGKDEIQFLLNNKEDSEGLTLFGNKFIKEFIKNSADADGREEERKRILEELKESGTVIPDDVFEKLSEDSRPETEEKTKMAYDFSHSLLALLYPLHEKIKNKGASTLLDKEWKEWKADNKIRRNYFKLLASLSLLALGVLRSNRRHSVTGDKVVKIYSHAQDSPDKGDAVGKWDEYCDAFLYEDDALKFFNYVYERIFRTTELYCKSYDMQQGENYEDETDKILNGYGYDQRYSKQKYALGGEDNDVSHFIGSSRRKTKIQKELEKKDAYNLKDDVEIDDVLKNLWHFMVEAHILCCPHGDGGYLLNLDDIRIRKDEKYDTSQPLPESLNQYYRVEEHTAQLGTEKGRIYQDLFSRGLINVLSCSTTFEMGVDLGDLNCIFLSNMPPTVANYKQRAGRAGRRVGSSSFVVTYIGKERNHDKYYSNRPDALLFGQVKRPKVYIDEDVSLRAKHFRAEALADFLRYTREKEGKMTSWRKCEVYFKGQKDEDTEQSYNLIEKYINAWCEENGENLQEHCQRICGGGRIEIMGSEYKVAKDFRCQLQGESNNYSKIFEEPNDYLYRWLSGPYLPDNDFNLCVSERYEEVNKYDDKGEADFISYLSENRVLPHYGFPCDVITLYPNPDFKKWDLDLRRDVRQGLFEYAPGRSIVADKRTYQSARPLSYKVGGYTKKSDSALLGYGSPLKHNIRCCRCNKDTHYFRDDSSCPECGGKGKVENVIVPDAFQVTGGDKAESFVTLKNFSKKIVYPGKTEGNGLLVSECCRVYCSDVRALWYINDQCKRNLMGSEGPHTLLREVSTDILLIGQENASFCFDLNRWESALAAILKATAEVLNVSLRDVEGLVTKINKKFYIVIYDASPSGSGIILPILPDNSNDSERNERKRKKILEILKKAREICTDCDCYERTEDEADKTVHSHDKYLHLDEVEKKQGREARSCYQCLKSYSNQRMHPYLDAREAARLIEELIGGEKDDDAPVSLPTTAQAESPQPAAAQETSEPSELRPEAPQSPDVPEASQGCELTEDDLNRIRHGWVEKGTKYRVRYEGKEIEVSYVNALGNGQQADRIAAEKDGVPLPRPILISDILKRL